MVQIKVEKVTVARKLSAKWTVETATDLESEIAAILADEIDWEIISSLLISEGWIKVELTYIMPWQVIQWVDENCGGATKHRHVTWLFKEPADATAFALKWA